MSLSTLGPPPVTNLKWNQMLVFCCELFKQNFGLNSISPLNLTHLWICSIFMTNIKFLFNKISLQCHPIPSQLHNKINTFCSRPEQHKEKYKTRNAFWLELNANLFHLLSLPIKDQNCRKSPNLPDNDRFLWSSNEAKPKLRMTFKSDISWFRNLLCLCWPPLSWIFIRGCFVDVTKNININYSNCYKIVEKNYLCLICRIFHDEKTCEKVSITRMLGNMGTFHISVFTVRLVKFLVSFGYKWRFDQSWTYFSVDK